MVHLINMLRFTPEGIRSCNEDKILILVVPHLGDIIEVHGVDHTEQSGAVHGVSGSDDGSLGAILDIHVVVIVTVSDTLEAPAATILELSWDIEPVPIVSHPGDGRSTIGLVDLEDVESRRETEQGDEGSLPELDPLADTLVLVDDLTFFEVQSGIGLHGRSLNEWLELIARIGRCSLESKDTLDRLLTHDRHTKSRGDVGELLILSPLNVILVSLIVVVVISSGSVTKLLGKSNLNIKEIPGWLSPPVVVIKEHIVQVEIILESGSGLTHVRRDIPLLINDARSHLRNMHINHQGVVSINFKKFVVSKILGVDVVLDVTVLMR